MCDVCKLTGSEMKERNGRQGGVGKQIGPGLSRKLFSHEEIYKKELSLCPSALRLVRNCVKEPQLDIPQGRQLDSMWAPSSMDASHATKLDATAENALSPRPMAEWDDSYPEFQVMLQEFDPL